MIPMLCHPSRVQIDAEVSWNVDSMQRLHEAMRSAKDRSLAQPDLSNTLRLPILPLEVDMRTLAVIAAGLIVSTFALGACSGDQPAATAPRTVLSFLSAGTDYTFSLSCNNAGTSTSAQITQIISHKVQGRPPLLKCGDHTTAASGYKSFDYQITLTNSADATVKICTNSKPIRSAGPITCQTTDGQVSATLTVS